MRTCDVSGVRVISPVGEIDISTAGTFRAAVAAEQDANVLIISLLETRYIDSSGLAVLVGADKERRANGTHLLIVLPPLPAARVFEITELDKLLQCFPGVDEAVARAKAYTK